MKITFKKGRKTENDFFIYVNANEEAIELIDLGNMVNQFALNELRIIKEKDGLSKDKHFWFKNLMEKAISDAENNIDWLKCNEEELKLLCSYPYFIRKDSLDRFIKEKK